MEQPAKQNKMNIQTLTTGWHFMRIVRLCLGIFIAVQAVQTHDSVSGFIAVFFLYQAVTDTGCCGSQGCAVPTSKKDLYKTEDIAFEEVKSK